MRIRKAEDAAGVVANVTNTQSDSTKDTYSCDYINDLVEESYSTSEVKTNKVWIDNKPIYRKVVTGTISGSQQTIASLPGNNVINIYGRINIGNQNSNYHIVGGYINANFYSGILMDNSIVNLWTPSGFSGSTYEIVIEYTKTTD